MKLTFLFLVVGLLQLSASVYSQSTKLSLEMRNAKVGEVLDAIESQSEFRFAYSPGYIDLNREVTVDIREKTIDESLKVIFAGTGIEFSVFDRHILLYPESLKPGAETVVSHATGAQQRAVSGIVTNEFGEPLPGVTVVVKGTTQGTVTNNDGNYSLTNIPEDATLVFSFVGMRTQEVFVGNQTSINVMMEEDVIGIEEVVAIGYGTINVDEVTSSVASITSDKFLKGTITDVGQLFKGKIPGVIVNTPSDNPLRTSQISLRGITTLMGTATPLILIDGIPGELRDVSPEIIESISVLKDASAAAIYGTRGSNGVILITTKSGITDYTMVNVKSYVNIKEITKKVDVMNATQYRELVGETVAWDVGSETDWFKEITQTPVSQTHDINLRGGWKNANYLFDIRFSEEKGLIKKSNIKMLQPRLEVNQTLFDSKLKLKGIIMGNQQKFYPLMNQEDAYAKSFVFNPTAPVYTEDGKFYEDFAVQQGDYQNPLALIELAEGETQNQILRLQGSASYNPVENLNIDIVGSKIYRSNFNGNYRTSEHALSQNRGQNGIASISSSDLKEDIFEISTQYSHTLIETHKLKILGGYSWNRESYTSSAMTNYDFPSDLYLYHSIQTGTALTDGKADMSSYKNESLLISYFARLNYNIANKYLFMASIRREGSSKFGRDNKWGNFPSLSLGWNILNEKFMEGIPYLSQLKVRTGYGVTGNIPIDPYMSLSRYNYNLTAFINGNWQQVLSPSTNPNPNLKWEIKEEYNIGLDFGFFDNRLTAAIDIYEQKTNDMLWNYSVPKPPYLFNTTTANAVRMKNKGLEIQLNMIPVNTQPFNWNSSVSYSANKNKVTSLSNENFQIASGYFYAGNIKAPVILPSHRVELDEPIGNFYGFKALDIDEEGYWIIEGQDGKPKSVKEQLVDDRKVIGNGVPNHYLSWNNTFNLKNFRFDIQMYGAFDFQIINNRRIFVEPPVALARGNVLNTAFHDVYGKRPLNPQQSYEYNSYYVEEGDYWKISNLTASYIFNLRKKQYLKNIELFTSINSLFTFTKYKGIDPEVSIMGLAPGVDPYNRFPATRTYTIGISLEL